MAGYYEKIHNIPEYETMHNSWHLCNTYKGWLNIYNILKDVISYIMDSR